MWVFAVRVFVADLAVGPVNDQLRLLIARDLARSINGLSLRVVDTGGALVAFTLHDPVVTALSNVLILSHDLKFLRVLVFWFHDETDQRLTKLESWRNQYFFLEVSVTFLSEPYFP